MLYSRFQYMEPVFWWTGFCFLVCALLLFLGRTKKPFAWAGRMAAALAAAYLCVYSSLHIYAPVVQFFAAAITYGVVLTVWWLVQEAARTFIPNDWASAPSGPMGLLGAFGMAFFAGFWLQIPVSAAAVLGLLLVVPAWLLHKHKGCTSKTYEDIDVLIRQEASLPVEESAPFCRASLMGLVRNASIYMTAVYLVWRLLYTLPIGKGWFAMLMSLLLFGVEALGWVETMVHFSNMANKKDYAKPDVKGLEWPDVDVFIATYNEPADLLYKTVHGCRNMDYPDPGKVHIYLCDDNRRPQIRALAKEMGVGYFDRPDNKGAKAGNLNNALSRSTSPYILTLDADMIPRKEFLLETIPYFMKAAALPAAQQQSIRLGFLQSPQAFYNRDLFQHNFYGEKRIPNEQDYFYRDIQVARTRSNSVIYGGTNTVISRQALLDIGGFYTEAITEDFATGLLMEAKGYVSLAIARPLASGLSPQDMKSLFDQRIRWGRGVIDTARSLKIFWRRDLDLMQKLNYAASAWYWYSPLKRLIYILCPILYAVFGVQILNTTLPQILSFWLPSYGLAVLIMYWMSEGVRSMRWTGIYETIMFPFLLWPIIKESLGITMKTFKVTNKSGSGSSAGQRMRYLWPFLLLCGLSVIGIVQLGAHLIQTGQINDCINLFWLVSNLYALTMAAFFAFGRPDALHEDETSRELLLSLEDAASKTAAVTTSIWENGFAADLPQYLYCARRDTFTARVQVPHLQRSESLEMEVKCVEMKRKGKQFRAEFQIVDHGSAYNRWLEILHGEELDFPTVIAPESTALTDLSHYILSSHEWIKAAFGRRQDRLEMDPIWLDYPCRLIEIQTRNRYILPGALSMSEQLAQARPGRIYTYTPQYLSLEGHSEPASFLAVVDAGGKQARLHCSYLCRNQGHGIYRIENMKEIMADPDMHQAIVSMLEYRKDLPVPATTRKQVLSRSLQKMPLSKKKQAARAG